MAKESQVNVFCGEFIPSLLTTAQNLVQLSPVGIFHTDPKGQCTYVNRRWCEITGLNAGQALGDGWIRALHPDDRTRISEEWHQAAQENRIFQTEYRFLHPGGTTVWVKGQAVAEHADKNQVTGYIGTITDITGLKRAEQALIESQRAFSTLISHLPGMVYRCKNDPDWTLEFANEGCLHLTGYPPSDLLRKKVNYADFIHPDDVQLVWDEVQKGVRAKRPYEITYRIRAKDGKVKWVWEQGQGIFSEQGELLALEGFITDISAQKYAEVALTESQRRFSTLVSNLPGIAFRCRIEPTYPLEFISDGCLSITGYSVSELMQDSLNKAELIHPDDRQMVWEGIQKNIAGKRPIQLTFRIKTKDGEEKWLWLQGSGIYSLQGELQALEGFVTDVSDQKYAEDELWNTQVDLERMVGERTADLSASNRQLQQEIIERRETEVALLESERSNQNLARNLPGIVYRVHMRENMRIQFFNDMLREITGYTEKEIRHMDDMDGLIHPEDYVRAKEIWTNAIRENQPFENEYRLRCKDKSVRNMVERGRPIRDMNNKPVYIEGVIFDSTQRKYTEERRLADLRQQRDTLVREVHHRIKNNLQGVVGLFSQYANEFPEVKDIIDTAISQVNSMAMVYGLHSASVEGKILFGELLQSISNSVKTLLRDNLVIKADHNRLNAYMIPQEEAVPIALILNELMINAIKHNSSDSHTVVVSVIHRNRESCLEMHIQNMGDLAPGFDFNQGRKTGMGLTLVRSLMPRSGAELSINSHDGMVTARLLLKHPVINMIG